MHHHKYRVCQKLQEWIASKSSVVSKSQAKRHLLATSVKGFTHLIILCTKGVCIVLSTGLTAIKRRQIGLVSAHFTGRMAP